MISVDFQSFNSQQLQIRFSPSTSQKNTGLVDEYSTKQQCLSSLHQKPDGPKNPTKTFHFSLSLVFKLKSHQIYWLYVFHRGLHRKFSSFRETLDGRKVDLCSLHQSLGSPNVPKSSTFVHFVQISNLYFSATTSSCSKVILPHQELNLKHNTCGGVLT